MKKKLFALGSVVLLSALAWHRGFTKGRVQTPSIDIAYQNKAEFFIDPMYAYDDDTRTHYFFSAFRRRSEPLSLDNPFKIGFVSFDQKALTTSKQMVTALEPDEAEFSYWRNTERSEKSWYGTGSIIKRGKIWYMFLSNSRVSLATSKDLKSWEKIKGDDAKHPYIWTGDEIPDAYNIRPPLRYLDPFVYFDEIKNLYVMLYIAERKSDGVKILAHNTSHDLIHWTSGQALKIPDLFGQSFYPEVPQIVFVNGRYHLFISYYALTEEGYEKLQSAVHQPIDKLKRGELMLTAKSLEDEFELSPCSRFLGNSLLRYTSRHFLFEGERYFTSMINGSEFDENSIPVPIKYSFDDDGCLRFDGNGAFEPYKLQSGPVE